MKRFLYIMLALFMVCSVFSGCSASKKNVPDASRKSDTAQSNADADNSLALAQGKGKVVVGVNPSFPPVCFRDENNEFAGFDVDMAKAAAKLMNVEVEFKEVQSEKMVDELNKHSIDLMWSGVVVSAGMEDKVLYSKPYLSDGQAFFVLKSSEISKEEDLTGRSVAIQASSDEQMELFESGGILGFAGTENITEYKNGGSALEDLEKGKVDAVLYDIIEGKYLVLDKKDNFRILNDIYNKREYAVVARPGDKALMMEVDSTLQKLKESGTAKQISEKWFGENIISLK